jgi:hypothetical protein
MGERGWFGFTGAASNSDPDGHFPFIIIRLSGKVIACSIVLARRWGSFGIPVWRAHIVSGWVGKKCL